MFFSFYKILFDIKVISNARFLKDGRATKAPAKLYFGIS